MCLGVKECEPIFGWLIAKRLVPWTLEKSAIDLVNVLETLHIREVDFIRCASDNGTTSLME